MKKSNPNIPSKDLISIMARQWAIMTDEEKQIYKIRAEQLKDQYMDPASLQQDASTEIDGIGLIEHSASDDNGGGKKKAAKKAGAKSPGSISVIIDV